MTLGSFWKRFFDLLPKTPRYSATVQSATGDGYYTVQLLGGASVRVRGSAGYVAGDRVFVADGAIENKAPALSSEVIEV